MRVLKFLLCFIAVPLYLAAIIGLLVGVIYLIINFTYIIVPLVVLGLWAGVAYMFYTDWFN